MMHELLLLPLCPVFGYIIGTALLNALYGDLLDGRDR